MHVSTPENERLQAAASRKRLEAKYPGVAEAAKARYAKPSPSVAGLKGIDWSEVWKFAQTTYGSVQAMLDSVSAELDAQNAATDATHAVQELVEQVLIEVNTVKPPKKRGRAFPSYDLRCTFTITGETLVALEDVCGEDADRWNTVFAHFGRIAAAALDSALDGDGDD